MPRVTKFNSKVISKLLELSELGNNRTDIAIMVGVSRNSLYRFLRMNPLVEQRMKLNYEKALKSEVQNNLRRIANGAKATETIREYIEEGADGKTVKVTEKIRIEKPDIKANQILARRYDEKFSDSEDVSTNAATPSIYINTSDMSLRELQQIDSPLGSIVEVESSEVDAVEYPPTKEESE